MNDIVAAALRRVNDARTVLGLEPLDAMPDGEPCKAYDCPIAVALRSDKVRFVGVTAQDIAFSDDRLAYNARVEIAQAIADVWGTGVARSGFVLCPPEITAFIREHDRSQTGNVSLSLEAA